jgi:hypothetical protein
MSEFFMARCRPKAKRLLDAHGLRVPDSTREMIAKTIMLANHASEATDDSRAKGRTADALSLHDTRILAKRLHTYMSKKRQRTYTNEEVIEQLARNLNDNAYRQARLIFARPSFDPANLLEQLARGTPEIEELQRLLDAINDLKTTKSKGGLEHSRAHTVVRGGFIAWTIAGRTETYTLDNHKRMLTGPLPAFLLDLGDLCGVWEDLTDSYLRSLIRRLKKDSDLLAHCAKIAASERAKIAEV